MILGKKKSSGVRQVPTRATVESGSTKQDLKPEHSNEYSSVNALSTLAIQEPKLSEISANDSKGADSNKGIGGSLEKKRLLVTYDNNDPEFDEDSDPDGDLDF